MPPQELTSYRRDATPSGIVRQLGVPPTGAAGAAFRLLSEIWTHEGRQYCLAGQHGTLPLLTDELPELFVGIHSSANSTAIESCRKT